MTNTATNTIQLPEVTPPAETKTPKTPKVVIEPWRALESGAVLKVTSVQTKVELNLVPTITTRGDKDNRWTYPSLGAITDANIQDLCEQVMAFRSEAWFKTAIVDAFDKECQDAWKNTQDEAKFITALCDETIQRTPKRMSTHYLKLANDLKKVIKDAGGKMTDEQKSTLQTYMLNYKKAVNEETEAEMAELMK